MEQSLVQERQASRRSRIFNLIRRHNEQLSRFDICKLTRYSTTTVTAVVDALVSEGLVIEDASKENRVGRRPSLLRVNSDSIYFLGIECSSSGINLTVIDAMQQIVEHEMRPIKAAHSAVILDTMQILLDNFAVSHPEIWQKIPSIVFSIPGELNKETGLALQYRTIPDWNNINFFTRFSYLGKQLLFINNVDAMLTGYQAQQQLGPEQSVMFIIMRNSAGVRLFSKGHLLSQFGILCEVGHMQAIGSCRRCVCGKTGCYDAEISTSAVINKLQAACAAGRIPSLQSTPSEITMDTFFRLIQTGEPAALDILSEVTRYTAQMLESLLAFFRPDVIVLSTYLCSNETNFEDSLRKCLAQRGISVKSNLICIPPANELASFGAAIVGYNASFSLQTPEL